MVVLLAKRRRKNVQVSRHHSVLNAFLYPLSCCWLHFFFFRRRWCAFVGNSYQRSCHSFPAFSLLSPFIRMAFLYSSVVLAIDCLLVLMFVSCVVFFSMFASLIPFLRSVVPFCHWLFFCLRFSISLSAFLFFLSFLSSPFLAGFPWLPSIHSASLANKEGRFLWDSRNVLVYLPISLLLFPSFQVLSGCDYEGIESLNKWWIFGESKKETEIVRPKKVAAIQRHRPASVENMTLGRNTNTSRHWGRQLKSLGPQTSRIKLPTHKR